MNTLRRIQLGSVLFFSLSAAENAHAGDCRDAASYGNKLVEAASKICEKVNGKFQKCDSTKLGGAVSEIQSWIKWWNQMFGNTWATIGPRQIAYQALDRGTLVSPGDRVWISVAPSFQEANVRIRLIDGKAKLTVSYCALKADGTMDFLGSDTAGSGQSPPQKALTREQVVGKFIVVKMDGQGGLGLRYQYDIYLDGQPIH